MSETDSNSIFLPKLFYISFLIVLFQMPLFLFGQNEKQKKKKGFNSRMEMFRVKKKDFKKFRYASIGGSLNFLTYYGDLAPTSNFLSISEYSMV